MDSQMTKVNLEVLIPGKSKEGEKNGKYSALENLLEFQILLWIVEMKKPEDCIKEIVSKLSKTLLSGDADPVMREYIRVCLIEVINKFTKAVGPLNEEDASGSPFEEWLEREIK